MSAADPRERFEDFRVRSGVVVGPEVVDVRVVGLLFRGVEFSQSAL